MRPARVSVLMALGVALLAAGGPAATAAPAQTPLRQNPLGPIVDVTARWQRYQPAAAFCIRPDAFELSGDTGATATGRDPACRRSGFGPKARGLYRVEIRAPLLCAGCRRLFLDYSNIPPENDPPFFYAHGHAYFRPQSANFSYTVDPIAHSPNVKNFTNDKLLAPDGSAQEDVAGAFDLHSMSYVGDTVHFIHSAVQGPWYIGPWYVNRSGRRILGAYLDVDVFDAIRLPRPTLNEIGYMAGFRSGEPSCPDSLFGYEDADAFYAGCVDRMGGSAGAIDPFASGRPED